VSFKYSPQARQDVRAALAYLDERSPIAAERLRAGLVTLVQALERGAFDGPTERLKSGDKVQSWPLPPLRIYYQRQGELLYIMRVYHQAQRPIVRRRQVKKR
jgi:plasmid stabilization system protein ParE